MVSVRGSQNLAGGNVMMCTCIGLLLYRLNSHLSASRLPRIIDAKLEILRRGSAYPTLECTFEALRGTRERRIFEDKERDSEAPTDDYVLLLNLAEVFQPARYAFLRHSTQRYNTAKEPR